jgi:hypothetical protein
MKEIQLTQGKVALVDDSDYEWLNKWKWHYGEDKYTGYAHRNIGLWPHQKKILMHREIMQTLPGIEVDHIDHNGCNNQRSNLRNCMHIDNRHNQMRCKNNKSGYIGVSGSMHNRKWRSVIHCNKKQIHLGCFPTAEEAALAYNEAAKKLFGEFACLNDV